MEVRGSFFLYAPALVELGFVAVALILIAAWPKAAARPLRSIDHRLSAIPTSLVGQILFIGTFAVLLRATFLPWLGAPVPLIHDEFSLLLQAQTYLEGRLANPSHELWDRFESFHINHIPAYASVYFPGRGLPLAFGLLVAGEPWLGVWLSFVLLAMSTVWMLRGWVSPRLALLGGMLVVVRLGAFSYWINSYWGGAFTALGAMLVVGAMPRIIKNPQWRYGFALGVGTVILMTTRPFEGPMLCGALGLFFLPRLLKRNLVRSALLRAGIPLAALVGGGAAVTAMYHSATTGDPLVTPYEVNRGTYAVAPAFIIAPLEKRVDRLERRARHFKRFYDEEARPFFDARSGFRGMLRSMVRKVQLTWYFYVGAALTIPFILGLWASRRDVPVVGTLVIFYAGFLLTTWPLPHYAAPIFPVLLIVTMRGLALLSNWTTQERPVGFSLARALPIAAASPLLVAASSVVLKWPEIQNNSWDRPCCAVTQSSVRSDTIKQLEAISGRDLVLVASNDHNPIHTELVFNDADIDSSAIVWAHSLGDEEDKELVAYYSDRRPWLFEWTADGYILLDHPSADP